MRSMDECLSPREGLYLNDDIQAISAATTHVIAATTHVTAATTHVTAATTHVIAAAATTNVIAV